ncbi:uncharacterized protein [Haliotis cracherodii]|uniref:uncharacterized protein n=1 Tax=Haliotis cracherodii TaxID=6455 RepID=UPI0039EA2967
MKMASLLCETVLVFLALIPGITAQTSDVNFLIASCTVAILLFIICIVMGIIFYNCGAIYKSFGYEKIPKHELKRIEVMKKLSRHSSEQYLSPQIITDRGSWIQRWSDDNVEERDAVMQLGPEAPEPEYRIETTLEDSVTDIDVHEGLYASVNKSGIVRQSSSSGNEAATGSAVLKDCTALL